MTSKKIKNMLVYILVIIVAALVALPFIWMVVSAFKSQRELFAYPPTFSRPSGNGKILRRPRPVEVSAFGQCF